MQVPDFGKKKYWIIDGGLGSALQKQFKLGTLWSAQLLIENPEAIQRVHESFFEAGADIVITSSYQASYEGFAGVGIDAAGTEALLQLSVAVAKAARGQRPGLLVAASCGPYGAILHNGAEFTGDYPAPYHSKDALKDWHRPRLKALVAAGPDLVAFETIPVLAEAEAVVELLEEVGCPAWLSFSCRSSTAISHGEAWADCVTLAARSPWVVALGLNCTSPELVSPLLETARRITDKPLLAYPNLGGRWLAETGDWDGDEDAAWPAYVEQWLQYASLLGGCCRTTPEHIRAIARAVAARQ